MVSHRSIGIRSSALACQMLLVTCSFWGWFLIWQSSFVWDVGALKGYLLYNEFLLIGILFSGERKREATGQHHEWVSAIRQSFRQTLVGIFCVFMVVFARQDAAVSRSFFFSYIPWLYLTLIFSRYFIPRYLGKWAFSGDREERVALAGTGEQAARLAPWLEQKSFVGLRTIGLICPQSSTSIASPYPVLGTIDHMKEILADSSITQVIVLDLSLGSAWIRQMTHLCEDAAVRLLAVNDLNAYFNHTTTVFEDDGIRFIGLREEPLESPMNRLFKRILDLAVALPVVVLILPFVTALVWCLHRLQSPGPVFFRQVRTGMMGRPFGMYKYRTMHVHKGDENKQASKNDPRIFSAGAWLRRFSVDEIPQFLNVVLGDMSVVGPRPHLPKHEELFARVMSRYFIRKFIRPGLTGWAQVSGFRGEIHCEGDIQKRVEADIYYLENWSFSLDCLIILRTIKHCIFPPRSAY
ncbi:MAG TPA: sugar transferase [Verrucomicrobiae bacterium]|nr:sugar transferase [Verrucomicrobiae bacterium]